MRSHGRDLPEDAQKMKLAHLSVGCQSRKGQRPVGLRVDEAKSG